MPVVQKTEDGVVISSSIANGLIVGVTLMVLGTTGGALYSAIELRQSIDKVHQLPSPDAFRQISNKVQKLPTPRLFKERRENTREWNSRQDRRLDRIERAIYGPINQNSQNMSFEPGTPPGPQPHYAILPAMHDKRRES